VHGLPGVEMAGKTGTAQVRRISRAERAAGSHKRKDLPWIERDHALFVCCAPLASPRYAVAVVVEHGMSGSKAASPIARDIMRKALQLDPADGLAVAASAA
jgi:penicillin-binding protein 2